MGRITRFLQKTTSSEKRESADIEDARMDPNLAKIIDAWPHLPKHIKQAMLALLAIGKSER
jgi:hypothetical protein